MLAEDAFDFLVAHLIVVGPATDAQGNRASPRNADIWIPDVAWQFWTPHINLREIVDVSYLGQGHLIPFYDAAWELCRIGVLRPGAFAPNGMSILAISIGDQYTITEAGKEWLQTASDRQAFVHSSRLGRLFLTFGARFGPGFAQRATEAVRSHRAANYLAACVMSGAASESILLAVAIAKSKNEAATLAMYNSSSGRGRVIKQIAAQLTPAIASRFANALGVLSYWRDDAGHGAATTIGEIEAHESLTRLLRLAQFSSDHWDILTV